MQVPRQQQNDGQGNHAQYVYDRVNEVFPSAPVDVSPIAGCLHVVFLVDTT